jgi:hypothetical protein
MGQLYLLDPAVYVLFHLPEGAVPETSYIFFYSDSGHLKRKYCLVMDTDTPQVMQDSTYTVELSRCKLNVAVVIVNFLCLE